MIPYKTVKNQAEAEVIIEKSRFIAYVKPVESENEANLFIEQIKKKHYNATHNVPVYLLNENMSIQRYSDDGEPSGTAGVPILEMLKKEGITNICILVTRYFGGTKLGTGGLVRAYTEAAKAGIEKALVVEKAVYHKLKVVLDYSLHGKVQNYLLSREGVIIEDTIFTDKVNISIFIKDTLETVVEKELVDLTADQIQISHEGNHHLTIHEGHWIE